MKVVVLGATGVVGRAAVEHFVTVAGCDVVAVSASTNGCARGQSRVRRSRRRSGDRAGRAIPDLPRYDARCLRRTAGIERSQRWLAGLGVDGPQSGSVPSRPRRARRRARCDPRAREPAPGRKGVRPSSRSDPTPGERAARRAIVTRTSTSCRRTPSVPWLRVRPGRGRCSARRSCSASRSAAP